jgi:hypothetical protein
MAASKLAHGVGSGKMSSKITVNPELGVVRCRPGNTGWGLIAICILFGSACMYPYNYAHGPAHNGGDMSLLLLGAAFMVAAFGFLGYMSFSRILVDETGIHWLGIRGRRSVEWDEVADYYQERLPKGTMATMIVTPNHTFALSEASWTNMPKLRKSVQERAKKARATSWCIHTDRPPYIEC